MTKHQTLAELKSHVVPFERVMQMSRADKLNRWADLIERTRQPMVLYHGLEYASLGQLERVIIVRGVGAFAVALVDPMLQAEGLIGTDKDDCYVGTLGDVMKFFELSQADLHEFSCDCGGPIDNHEMAQRVRAIAVR